MKASRSDILVTCGRPGLLGWSRKSVRYKLLLRNYPTNRLYLPGSWKTFKAQQNISEIQKYLFRIQKMTKVDEGLHSIPHLTLYQLWWSTFYTTPKLTPIMAVVLHTSTEHSCSACDSSKLVSCDTFVHSKIIGFCLKDSQRVAAVITANDSYPSTLIK